MKLVLELKKKIIAYFFLLVLLTPFLAPSALRAQQNTQQATGLIRALNSLGLIDNLSDFISSPTLFFQGLQYDADDLSPSFFKQYYSPEWRSLTKSQLDNLSRASWAGRFSISSNLLSDLAFILNYSLKGHPLKESTYLPQITLSFSHFFYVPVYSYPFSSPYKEILQSLSTQGFGGSLVFSKSITSIAKFFGGYRYAFGYLKLNIPTSALPSQVETVVSIVSGGNGTLSVDTTWHLHDLIFGVSLLPNDSLWQTMMVIGYNPELHRVFLKAERRLKYWGFGIGYYPDNIISIRPYLRFYFTI